MKAMPRNAPAMHPNVSKTGSKRSPKPSRKIAGTENIMPDEAPFTPDAMVCTMLFSTMLLRRNMPRRMPKPRMAASSDPSIENPRIRAAYPIATAMMTPINQPVTSATQVNSGYGRATAAGGLLTPLPLVYFFVRLPQRFKACPQLIFIDNLSKFIGQRLTLRDASLPDPDTLFRFKLQEVRSIRNLAERQSCNKLGRGADQNCPVNIASLRPSPCEPFIEPARHNAIVEMREQRQPFMRAVRQVQVVIDNTTVTIDTRLCARDISPGRGTAPPPTSAGVDAVWCGARNGGHVQDSSGCGTPSSRS